MDKNIECYDENEFKTNQYNLFWKVWRILHGIPGHLEFSQYLVDEEEDWFITYHICCGDENDEDRTFTMDWDNEDTPYEKAHIEVATD